jgi:hypothetical protein
MAIECMKRLPLAIAALALCAGCATGPPRKTARVAPPDLPPPGRTNQAPPSVARTVRVLWTVDASALDTLETSAGLAEWSEIAGPYDTLDTGGALSYSVPIGNNGSNAFFRIRRVFGQPWVNTPKIESKTETEK